MTSAQSTIPIVLGLGGSCHDFSAAIARGTDIRVAIEEERLSRRKHGASWWYQNPVARSTDYCLKAEALELGAVDVVVSSELLPLRAQAAFPSGRLRLYPHHRCHAESALLVAPPAGRTGVIVYDGMGSIRDRSANRADRETFSFWLLEDRKLIQIGETSGTSWIESDMESGSSNSIGHLYDLVTLVLGFGPFEEGKTMGLAAFGEPSFLPLLERHAHLGGNMDCCFEADPMATGLAHELEAALASSKNSFQARANLAASIQALIEKVLLHCWSLMAPSNPEVLAVAGGCGLNSVANGRLSSVLPASVPLIIPPFPGDAGLALGAIGIWARELDERAIMTFFGASDLTAVARPGRLYSQAELDAAVLAAYPRLAEDTAVKGPADIADRIAAGEIVGCFNGRSEMGPRALGGRSIFASPRHASTRERLNRQIKRREPFRPLAPMVLASRFDAFFSDPRQADSFMIKVAAVRPERQADIPAVVHVDGTARVQVIPDEDPFIGAILRALEEKTDIPIMINTSFNRRGEPIVETPGDAVDAFLGLGLDGLWLENRYFFAPGT